MMRALALWLTLALPCMAQAQAGPGLPSLETVTAIFRTVCIGTAPGFAEAEARMRAAGVTRPEPREAGLTYHTELNISMKVFENEGGATLCSLVYLSEGRLRPEGAAIRKVISRELGVESFRQLRDDLLQFDTAAGDRMLLWGPYDTGDDLHRVVLIHE